MQKAGLIELTDDDRAVLLGAFLAVTAKLQGEEREPAITLWRRRGKRLFSEELSAHQTRSGVANLGALNTCTTC